MTFEIELRSEEHTSELQSLRHLVCRLLLEKKNKFVGQAAVGLEKGPGAHAVSGILCLIGQFGSSHRDQRFLNTFLLFFNDPPTTKIYPLPLHDALPIWYWASAPAARSPLLRIPSSPPFRCSPLP